MHIFFTQPQHNIYDFEPISQLLTELELQLKT